MINNVLILDVKVDEANFVLVNTYNPNTKMKQVATLLDLDIMLETIEELYEKHIVLTGDFNFSFYRSLDSCRRKPTLKKKSFANLSNLNKSLICVAFEE